MIKIANVRDSQTGEPIPYASVEITDQQGVYLGAGASTDGNGNFSIDSLQMQQGSFMRISSVGYKTVSFPYDQYSILRIFPITKQSTVLDEVVITAKRKVDQTNKIAAISAIGLLIFLFATSKKMRL